MSMYLICFSLTENPLFPIYGEDVDEEVEKDPDYPSTVSAKISLGPGFKMFGWRYTWFTVSSFL